ncbi:MAG: thioredoxin family protein [Planktotalea arctica]
MLPLLSRVALGLGLAAALASSALAAELIMVEQKGCHYCEAWMDEIAPAYPNTAEGKFAPLLRRDLHDGAPEGAAYARRVNFTPTFILMDEGQEIGRIEGYPGEDFFWPQFNQQLKDNTPFVDERI